MIGFWDIRQTKFPNSPTVHPAVNKNIGEIPDNRSGTYSGRMRFHFLLLPALRQDLKTGLSTNPTRKNVFFSCLSVSVCVVFFFFLVTLHP